MGIGVVVPHLRPKIAQLAYLHVSAAFRGTGIVYRSKSQICYAVSEYSLMAPLRIVRRRIRVALRSVTRAGSSSAAGGC